MKPTASLYCETGGADASTGNLSGARAAGARLELREQKFLTLFLALLVIPVLYILRFLDDNTLTSWKWVFTATGFGTVYLGILAAVILSYPLAVPDRLGTWGRYAVPVIPAVLVLVLHDIPELMLDSSRYFLQAKHLEMYGVASFFGEWGHTVEAWTDLPAVPFIHGVIFRLFGEERLWVQLANGLVLGGSAWLVYGLGRRLWTIETGISAGLFVSAMPFLLLQGPLMMVDIYAMFFLLLTLYLFSESLSHTGILRPLAGACALALMLLTKYSMGLMLPVVGLFWLGSTERDKRGGLKRALGMILTGLFLAGLFVTLKWDVVRLQLELLRDFQLSGLGRWKEGHVSTFFFQMHPFLVPLALLGAFRAFRDRDRRILFIAWIPVVALVLGVERSRYLLPLYPLVALGAGYGLTRFRNGELRRMLVLCVTGTSIVVLLAGYGPFVNGDSASNLRDAAGYLEELPARTVYVYPFSQEGSTGNTAASVALLDLFSHKDIRLIPENILPDGETRFALSPLRFTWRLGQPSFYSFSGAPLPDGPVVFLSDRLVRAPYPPVAAGTPERTVTRQFLRQATPFRYKTLVTILE